MINLMKLEIYKLKKNISFKVICLGVVFIELMYVYKNGTITGIKAFECSMYDVATMMVVGSIFASLFIGGDFLNRTINQTIVSGHSRLSVFLSKVIIVFFASEILMLIYPLASVIINTSINGFGATIDMAMIIYIIRTIILRIVIDLGLLSLLVFFAFIFKDTLKTIGISILTFLVGTGCLFTLGKNNEIINYIYKLTANSQARMIVDFNISFNTVISIIVTNIIIMLVLVSCAYIFFRKYDLR